MDSSREPGTLLFSFLPCFYSQWPVLPVTAVFFPAPPALRGETQRGGEGGSMRTYRFAGTCSSAGRHDPAQRSDRWSGINPAVAPSPAASNLHQPALARANLAARNLPHNRDRPSGMTGKKKKKKTSSFWFSGGRNRMNSHWKYVFNPI